MADLNLKTFDAVLIECKTQTDIVVRNLPFENHVIAIEQENPEGTDSVRVFIDAEDLPELLTTLEHFQTQHIER